ncbi:2-succinyl-6-hydroxy-2,4-cyclohexadiene-1-carboxylate synthase (plasmid) [Caballeronia sp. SBC1]|uniref:alpha/beta fold hydrolase n=1 Tax=unclassified Caballeronia TaxID=2646786 RepID=UPI0013E1A267|nr:MULTISPECIES: alpha/beta hydrolase [unclassified Caballeronia]QIE27669.1 2-succinyl-6-hydroxy-2,4-cyclohexadiene-1-carboxylate synthase [Caballeronia sp. SBC2]QIN65735.1 2-succinyl-6-hydroxy-2,4-cyclohexadiene-1-carboxylate synthase [Caballeronia sp. SBC1]
MERLVQHIPAICVANLPATDDRESLRLEYQWLNADQTDAPLAVFLHEGLGSISMWKDWPQKLCEQLGFRGLVYSRPGYGGSTARAANVKWPLDFMQRQAHDVLPAMLDVLGIGSAERARMWVIGHSDGGSIALLYAVAFPDALCGVIAIAPHVFVEDKSVKAIAEATALYTQGDLRARLSRYHADVDSAFYGWNDIWLNPDFRHWNITALLPSIRCPLLAVQGYDDEYATMAQIDAIASHVPQAQLAKLPACGHSPHRQCPAMLDAAIAAFVKSI